MNIRRVVLLVLVALLIGLVVGYFFKDEKVITVEKEKIVYKYIKGDTITQKPDGTIVVQNGTIDSTEHSNEYSKTEINKNTFALIPFVGIGNGEYAIGGLAQKDIFGSLGLAAGGLYNPVRSNGMVLIGASIRF